MKHTHKHPTDGIKTLPFQPSWLLLQEPLGQTQDHSEGHILSQQTGSPLAYQTGDKETSQDGRYPGSPISTKG